MSRDAAGIYSAPSNSFNPAVEGATIDEGDWNTTLTDIEAALTDSLSISGKGKITAYIDFDENASPGTPASNVMRLYAADNGSGTTVIRVKDSAGTVTTLGAGGGGGGGDVATDTIWDAKGDLVGGTGADTAARLPVGTNGQVLTADSAEATGLKWTTVSGTGDALVANPLSQFAATTSAQLAGVISDETGSGALVFATSPTLVTPALGTPSALVLTNATGLPASALVASTSQAVGFGTVELGHASDTTLSRISAGLLGVEGKSVATLSTQQAWTSQQTSTLATLTDAANISWDVSTAQKAKVTIAASRTMDAVTNAVEGTTYLLWVIQSGSTRIITWTTTGAGSFDFGTDGAPTLSTTSGQADLLAFEAISIGGTLKLRFAGIKKGFT